MGCSPSALSISGSMSMQLPIPTNYQPSSECGLIANRSLLSSVDLSSDTWDLVDDYEEEYYHVVVNQNVSLHKLLDSYEFVETKHFPPLPLPLPAAVHQDLNVSPNKIIPPPNHNETKPYANVVLYITSMRGIRKTYDDCCAVNSILDGFRVAVDKKDIAMDVVHRRELQSLMGLEGKPISFPQLFIGAVHVGGADEVRELYESGELRKLLEGCRVRGLASVQCICGDARFLMCFHCSGSKKLFHEHQNKSSSCFHCNENGLIKCPTCNN